MAHHHAHARTITLTLPRIPVRSLIRSGRRRARRFEQQCARHWPFAAYTVLTLATAGYVIWELTTI